MAQRTLYMINGNSIFSNPTEFGGAIAALVRRSVLVHWMAMSGLGSRWEYLGNTVPSGHVAMVAVTRLPLPDELTHDESEALVAVCAVHELSPWLMCHGRE